MASEYLLNSAHQLLLAERHGSLANIIIYVINNRSTGAANIVTVLYTPATKVTTTK